MSDFQAMLEDSPDLDTRLEVASVMLKQAADEEGVDLSAFSQEELGDMLGSLVEGDAGGGGEAQQGDGKTAGVITYADVSHELYKRAAQEDLDLSLLSRQQFDEVFDKVAAEMTDPAWAEEVQKQAQIQAQMHEYGAWVADGFAERLDKLAEDKEGDPDDDEEKKEEAKKKVANKAKEMASKAWEAAKSHGGRAANWAGRKERGASAAVGEKIQHGLLGKTKSYNRDINTGRAAIGGTAALGAAGTAAAMHGGGGRKKKASAEGIAMLIEALHASGYEL